MSSQDRVTQLLRAARRACITALIAVGSAATVAAVAQPVESAATLPAPRFDVHVEDAPVRAFFRGLVDGTKHNVLVHPDVSGTVTLTLNQVTLEETLDAVRDMYGYDYRRVSSGYLVLPATVQTRLYSLNYLDLQRTGASNTRISSGQITQETTGNGASQNGSGQNQPSNNGGQNGQNGENGEQRTDVTGTSVLTRSESDFWSEVEANLREIIGGKSAPGRSVVINRQSGVIVVRALPNEQRDVADYLNQTERTVGRQVVLEAKVVEVELSDAYQAGINWAAIMTDGNKKYFLGQRPPQGGFDVDPLTQSGERRNVFPGSEITEFMSNTLGGAFTVAADLADFNAYIDLLGLQGRTRVLSSPRVSTLHNQKAVIKAGSDEFFVTGIESDTTTGNSTTTTVEYELTPFFSGVALDVTPQISDDGRVLLHIHPTISDVTDQTKSLSVRGETDTLPLALSQIRESDSIVKARSGQVIVIGGLMREQRTRQDYKTPLLGDIPGLGRLFRSERDQTTTTELVILLRPIVIDDEGQWDQLVKEPTDRIESMSNKAKLK